VFFQDPADSSAWHVLRWNGLPPEGEVPAFSDATAADLLREARHRGLAPQSDAQLLPVLLELLGGLVPVKDWPTQLSRSQRTGHARQAAQARAAQADRGGPAQPQPGTPAPDTAGKVVPLRWPERAREAREAIDSERRRRREAVVTSRPEPPPLLRDALRSQSRWRIPDEDDEGPAPGSGEPGQENG
jgi:hypothetical protein